MVTMCRVPLSLTLAALLLSSLPFPSRFLAFLLLRFVLEMCHPLLSFCVCSLLFLFSLLPRRQPPAPLCGAAAVLCGLEAEAGAEIYPPRASSASPAPPLLLSPALPLPSAAVATATCSPMGTWKPILGRPPFSVKVKVSAALGCTSL